jgi:Flp pilus assembly pilin Flp
LGACVPYGHVVYQAPLVVATAYTYTYTEEMTMRKVWFKMANWQESEQGQDVTEYAMLIGLIALVLFVAVTVLGDNLSGVYDRLASYVGAW